MAVKPPSTGSATPQLAVGTETLAGGAQSLDAQLHLVAGGRGARRSLAQPHAGGRACRNHVARQEGHELTDVTDERRHVEDEVAGRATLLGLTVELEP